MRRLDKVETSRIEMKRTQLGADKLHAMARASADHYEIAVLMKRDVAIADHCATFHGAGVKYICSEFEHRLVAKPKMSATAYANCFIGEFLAQVGEILRINMADNPRQI